VSSALSWKGLKEAAGGIRGNSQAADLAWLLAGSLSQQSIGLLSTVLVARYFVPGAVGEMFLLVSWMAAFSVWGLPGLSSALLTSVARGEGGTFRRAVRLESLFACGGTLCLLFVGWWREGSGNHLNFLAYGAVALLFPLYLNDCGFQAMAGRRRYRQLTIIHLGQRFTGIVWLMACIHFGLPIAWLLTGNVLQVSAFNGALILWNWHRVGDAQLCRSEAVSYGAHLTVSNIVLGPLGELERLLVGLRYGGPDLAVFGLGEAVFSHLRVLANQSHSLYFPRVAAMPPLEVYRYLRIQAVRWTIGFLILAALLAVLLPWVYPFLFGPNYASSALFAGLYAFAAAFGVPNFFINIYLRHFRATRATYWYGLARAPLQLSLLTVCFVVFGIYGLPLARGLTVSLHALIGWGLIRLSVERGMQVGYPGEHSLRTIEP
jgi:O-antigen/teichoic acid export membrane protein